MSLCADCGLCCNGVLHPFTWVDEHEVERLREHGLRVAARDSSHSFPQPCTALREPLCAIYAERPGHCRRYRCALLKRFEAGEVAEGAARQTISRTRDALRRTRDALGLQPGEEVWPAATALLEALEASPSPTGARRAQANALRAIAELEIMCRKAFLQAGAKPGDQPS